MEKGYIKLHRQIFENDLYFCETFTKSQAWIDILLLTNYKDGLFFIRGNEVKILRGQFAYAERTLEKRWKWSRGKIRRFFEMLASRGMITKKTVPQNDHLIAIYSVANYEDFQYDVVPQTEPQTIPQTNHRQDRNNKDNKDKESNNNIIADKQRLSPKTKVYTRLPEDKRQLIHRVGYHLEDVLKTQIVNWGKQAKAVGMMQRAGYTEKQICWVIDQMAQEEFYEGKGFDLMTVANSIAQYKARARKAVNYVLSEAN